MNTHLVDICELIGVDVQENIFYPVNMSMFSEETTDFEIEMMKCVDIYNKNSFKLVVEKDNSIKHWMLDNHNCFYMERF